MKKLTKVGTFKTEEEAGNVFTDGYMYFGFTEKNAYVLEEHEFTPTENGFVTVTYEGKSIDEYDWYDDDCDYGYRDYEEEEREAYFAAADLMAMDLEDTLNKVYRREPFLLPKGWYIEYIYH